MTDNELLQAIYNDTQELKQRVTGLEKNMVDVRKDITDVKSELSELKQDITDVKSDLKQLQCDANFILDEVERVHGFLDKHKKDKTVHTA